MDLLTMGPGVLATRTTVAISPLTLPFLTSSPGNHRLLSVYIDLATQDIPCEQNHITYGLLCLVSFIYTHYFQGSSMVLYVSVLHSFLQLHNIPLNDYFTFYFSTQLLEHLSHLLFFFSFLTIMNNVTVNIRSFYVNVYSHFSWDYT